MADVVVYSLLPSLCFSLLPTGSCLTGKDIVQTPRKPIVCLHAVTNLSPVMAQRGVCVLRRDTDTHQKKNCDQQTVMVQKKPCW